MTETHVAGHGRFWPLELAEPPPPPGPIVLHACNTVVINGGRNALTAMVFAGRRIGGTTWRITASNPGHDAIAITNPHVPGTPIDTLGQWLLIAGVRGPVADVGAGAAVLANLSPAPLGQGSSPAFSALTTQVVTIHVPESLTIADAWGFTVGADYAPGVVTINECWHVELECLDCEEEEISAAGGLLRGHGALAADF